MCALLQATVKVVTCELTPRNWCPSNYNPSVFAKCYLSHCFLHIWNCVILSEYMNVPYLVVSLRSGLM
jgi:hypothetical protein